jgi:hypothetical protein
LQRRVFLDFGPRDGFEHHIEQRLHRFTGLVGVIGGVAKFAGRKDVRKIAEHVLAAKVHQELEAFVERFVRSGIGPVDLVHHDDWLQLALKCLREDIASLRHRTFGCIDQHERPIGHAQHALDFAAKIGVARRIDEIDLHALVMQGDVLGEDCDAALALQIVRIEDAIADKLRGAKFAALAQQAIDQRRLPMIDVGDDGDISNVGAAHGGKGGVSGREIEKTY